MRNQESNATAVLRTLFAHNTWANLKLLEFCERLRDEQLDATAVGGFGSIRRTLCHIVGAAVDYVERINGKRPAMLLGEQFPGFAALKELTRWAGEELLQAALSAQAETLVREDFPQERLEYRLASLIVQEITHASEHRAQIATILTQLGLEPPDMSVWYYIEESGEFKSIPRA